MIGRSNLTLCHAILKPKEFKIGQICPIGLNMSKIFKVGNFDFETIAI